jgi:hypothetical protein
MGLLASIVKFHMILRRAEIESWVQVLTITQKPTIYRVDYYVQRPGSASRARFRLTGFVSQHLRGASMLFFSEN